MFDVRVQNRAPMFEVRTGETPEDLTGPWVVVDATIFLHPAPPPPPTYDGARIEA